MPPLSLGKLGVSQKIWGGFTIVLLMLALVAGTSFYVLTQSEVAVDDVVNVYQPRTLASLELSRKVEETAGALGFYLLSKDDAHKKNYSQGLASINESYLSLKELLAKENDPKLNAKMDELESLINKFSSYDKKMLELAADDMKNFPAMQYASENINPLNRIILQDISNMVMSEKEEEASAERKALLLKIESLRYNWSTMAGHIRTYLIMGQKSAFDNVMLYYEQFVKELGEVEASADIFTFEQEEFYESVVEQSTAYKNSLTNLVKIFEGDQARMDSYVLRTELGPLLLSISGILENLVEEEKKQINQTSGELLSSLAQSKLFITGLLVVGMVIGILASIIIARLIVTPLRDAVNAMNDIAQGEGDLTKRLRAKGKDEVAQLAHGFNAFAEKTQTLISSSAGVVEQFDEKLKRVYTVSQETQDRADKQQLQTEQVADNIREVSENVEAVTSNAGLAVEAADAANAATLEGQKVVDETIESIESMAGGVEQAADVIRSLSEKSDKIGMVIDVIKGIAEQTNLLALNAAIEAARAGEQGRGFAVVADEVRTLASRTQESTDEIESMINELQHGANQAAETMEGERQRAGDSVDQVTKTVSAFESIYNSVSTISDMNHKIEEAAHVQQTKAEQVNAIIAQLLEIAEENAAGAQQTHSATNELTELEAELSKYMKQFKTS